MKLLIFNYSMNSTNQVFSHQRKIALELAKFFDEIDIVTSENYTEGPIGNIEIFSTRWKMGRTIRNLIVFYAVTIPLLLKHRRGIVFSHMTDVQSALIAVPCRILGIRHVLWYAHRSSSFYLRICYPFLDVLSTSTEGSCPISGGKVVVLGQAIDASIAERISAPPRFPPKSWYHVGRIDPSKNIEVIIRAIKTLNERNQGVELHFYGAPSSKKFLNYYQNLKTIHEQDEWISFHGHLNSYDLPEVASLHDGFIHAFWGSLDKSLVEAIMLRRIVVSANPEYLHQFENIKVERLDVFEELMRQLGNIYSQSQEKTISEIERKFRLAHTSHDLKGWIERLLQVLMKQEDCQ